MPLFEFAGSLDFIPGAISLYDLDPGRTRFSAFYQRSAWTHKTHTIWERGLITDFLPVLTTHRSNTYHVLTLPTRQGGIISLTRNLCWGVLLCCTYIYIYTLRLFFLFFFTEVRWMIGSLCLVGFYAALSMGVVNVRFRCWLVPSERVFVFCVYCLS